ACASRRPAKARRTWAESRAAPCPARRPVRRRAEAPAHRSSRLRDLDEPPQRERDALPAHGLAIPGEELARGRRLPPARPREPDRADRLVRRAAVGPRDAADRDRERDAEPRSRPL